MHLFRAAAPLALALLCFAAHGCDAVSCDDFAVDVGGLCVPDAIAPDQSSVIEVRESCGQCSSTPTCQSTLRRDGAVYLELHEQQCSDVSILCPASACLLRIARCTLPALGAGDYPLVVPGSPMRILRVRAGGQSSCQLPGGADGGT